ncbi:hypothetical protein CHLRE_12g502678v5 [Chlamydomonas reinhardtii]|uniref:Uncharacterized protein n=1 Tax=Chlamydomonas reinhardtii TaxID=3055 RepID=A0A2K3D368_CHLRE|nr:uncharacterized protein CHLRE_12g502678v5 [Chlamydomonas reinhardtii]PNW74957.1 hypothetical protein CHLRE_12g502678v5 [Chlamydomonas reinhardtii]
MLPGSAAGGRGRGAGPPAKPSSAARRSSQSSSSAAPAAEALEAGNANGGASASSGCALSTAELKVLLSAAQRLFQPCPRCFNAAGGTRNAHTCFLDLNQITVSAG